MRSKKIAQPEYLLDAISSPNTDKTVANVLCFSKKLKAKKTIEAKRRVYKAATNLNW